MQNSWQKRNTIIKSINQFVVDLPTPTNISTIWNFGSLATLCLIIQIITGLFLAIFYTRDIKTSFDSVDHIIRNVTGGWLIRLIHCNGGSLIFICLYTHIGRGIYYILFLKSNNVWESGVTIFIVTIATAFFGYILPWGQISFWGATVITSLFSAIPFIGQDLVEWVWGGFALDAATLTRFFALHFICPFLIVILAVLHIIFIHSKGSRNPLGLKRNYDKIKFHAYFSIKDAIGFAFTVLGLFIITTIIPYLLIEPDNFLPANPLSTPTHIQPEWYFLFAYTILRSIPNKLGGVIALAISLIILYIIPLLHINKKIIKSYLLQRKIRFWFLVSTFVILTWIGICPVEPPYEIIGKLASFIYFLYFLITPFTPLSKI